MQTQSKKQALSLIAWVLYDLANSAHAAIIQTFIFAAYFVNDVAINKTSGVSLWGLALSLSGFIVAIGGPILGAIADQSGRRKRWLAFFTYICIISIALMWFVKPSSSYTLLALILLSIAICSSEFAYIYYNAMLPELALPEKIGRWSGWGWAAGYLGGMVSLILCFLAFIHTNSPWIKLERSSAEDIRATFLFSALWFLVFSVPIFFCVPESQVKQKKSLLMVVKDSWKQLLQTVQELQAYGNIFRFLLVRMIFTDALITLFAFGGVYAAGQFNMQEEEILMFGIALNVSAGIGAAFFAFFDDLYGGKKMILLSLAGLIFTGSMSLLAQSKVVFWIWGTAVGLFVGPAQASSRSFMARVTPPGLRNQMFGFFSLSAKVTAFLGPMSVSWMTYLTGSIKVGMSPIIFFMFIGFCLMLTIKKDK